VIELLLPEKFLYDQVAPSKTEWGVWQGALVIRQKVEEIEAARRIPQIKDLVSPA